MSTPPLREPSPHRYVYIVHISVDDVNSVNIICETSAMSGDRYHHGALDEALVTAALAHARSNGPGSLSVRLLAAEVGVSPAAVYRHFSGLEALVSATAQAAREELARSLLAARERPTTGRTASRRALRRLEAVGRAYVEFALAEPRLFETAFTPCSVTPERPDAPGAWQVLLDCVSDLVASEAIDERVAVDAPLIAWSAVHGLATILVRTPTPDAIDADRAIEAVVGTVVRSLESHPPRRRRD
jgi:AcrR family transcriptional regulator